MEGKRARGWGVVLVRGTSMAPTFQGWRRLAVMQRGRVASVGDVVVAARPDRPELLVVKRVTEVSPDGVWLESDAGTDDAVRSDSWLFGPVPSALVRGVVVWPRVSGPRPR